MNKEEKTFLWKVFFLMVGLFILLSVIGFVMRSCDKLGNTIVEREVFENSYQRSESIKAQIATDQAVLAELERKLMNPELSETMKANLEAQISAARMRIAAAKERQ